MNRRKERRRRRLEEIAKEGNAFCNKHNKYLEVKDVFTKHCYTGNHGRSYCSYLEIEK